MNNLLTRLSALLLATCTLSVQSFATTQQNEIDAKALTTLVEDLAAQDKFSGAVLLANGSKVLYSGAYGLASKRFNVANNLQTKFNLGSMNKMFTAVAIMQLVEAGKLSLTDKLSQFVDDTWLPKSVSEQIEIQHLLSHTSGLGSYFNREFIHASREQFRHLEDYKKLVQNEKLRFKPGTSYHYSNTGMLMLGLVIAKSSGQSYYDYIRQHIYQPAGMINTDSYDMDQPIANLAIGYMPSKNNTGWKNNVFMHVIKGGPAGGGFSTVEDLHRFALALTQYKLLNKKHTALLLSSKPTLGSTNYGYGFRIKGDADNRIVGHDGAFPGIDANLDIYLDKGYIAIVLANYGRSIRPITSKINALL